MAGNIVVTGIGIVSAIGLDVQQTFDSLVNKKTGIAPLTILDTVHKDEFVMGEIKLSNNELVEKAEVDAKKSWTRTALLGIIAAKQAVADAGLSAKELKKAGLISASTVGGMDRSELYYKDFLKGGHQEFIDMHHAGDSTEKIAETIGIKGFLSTVSTACSSSLNSQILGVKMLKSGLLEQVIVGGTDALSRFTLNGFNTLMILDRKHCRPFDATRTGLNLGEGAAFLVLETEESAKKAGRKIYATLAGYGNANDANHQTATSDEGDGPFLSMQKALKVADIKPDDTDYINVHGTGTENNDLTEGKAIKRLFGNNVPPFSSTKAFTGHTLGAAGVIESVFAILTLQHQVMFPNVNFKTAIPEINLTPVTEVQHKKINYVMTNSFGFGGNDSSVVFGKAPEM
jgi:3-oxoacyl-[acyl-carrier-protein] synthase-1